LKKGIYTVFFAHQLGANPFSGGHSPQFCTLHPWTTGCQRPWSQQKSRLWYQHPYYTSLCK